MSFCGLRSGIRWRSPRLARRHPNVESEGFWDGPISMVRPDLRRDMVGIPKISVLQERERDVEYPKGTSSPRGSTVLGNPVSKTLNMPVALQFHPILLQSKGEGHSLHWCHTLKKKKKKKERGKK
jgi:hypothetical protein